MRCLILAASLIAPTLPQIPAESPPTVLVPYIHGSTFEPGDYRWLKGQFDGASPAEIADNISIMAWRKRCRTTDLAQARINLTDLGIDAGPSLNSMPYHSLICGQVATLPESMNQHNWDGFAQDVATVQPIAQGFLAAVVLAEQGADPHTPALRDQLNARSTGEQILRRGLEWANGDSSNATVLSLTSQQRGILVSIIAIAMQARDHANTEWLKTIVASEGWPTRKKVGASAAGVAWLLAQHADADPAFQVRALRLMKPAVVAHEINPSNYAYLYDRVMLKLVGKQRYASQLICRAGHYVPQPLEDESKVDVWRRRVGLMPLAEYEQQIAKDEAPCNEVPIGG